MKKIILSLIAVMATMSINAQVVKVYENGSATPKAAYCNTTKNKYTVVFTDATIGEAAVSESAGIADNKVQWVQLWKDGPMWAVCNVGAKSVSEYGNYYYWGSTNTTDYCQSTADIQGTTYDTAMTLWGDNWQMPTETDFANLLSTTYTDGGVWKSAEESGYGIAGLLVTGKGDYAGNSVFFPASGLYTSGVLTCEGTDGNYWASSPYDSNASELYFRDEDKYITNEARCNGMFVRPVIKSGATYMPAIKVYDNGKLTATYNNTVDKIYKVIFEKTPEYVEIGGIKWATMNLGATTVAGSPATCYGDYYAWGETEPRYTSMTITDAENATFGGWSSSHSSGYSINDYPTYTGTTLDAAHDAATQNWGSDWRTPTKDDFEALVNACTGSTSAPAPSIISTSTPAGGIYWLSSSQTYLPEYSGVAGILFVDKTDTSKRVFFPAAGCCCYSGFYNGGSNGLYWSLSLGESIYYASCLNFQEPNVNLAFDNFLAFGISVRPVSE